MASLAILRRRKILSDYLNVPVSSVQSLQRLSQGQSSGCLDQRYFTSGTNSFSQTSDDSRNCYDTSILGKQLNSSSFGIFGHKTSRITYLPHLNGRLDFSSLIAARFLSQPARHASTATANQQDLETDNEGDNEISAKRRKEASPEECDQAVVGLSTAKAKAKAKKLQESHRIAKSSLKRLQATFLGIGPALRAVASMSRYRFYLSVIVPAS